MKRFTFPLITATLLGLQISSPAADPTWWASRGVINSSSPRNLSPATVGQAKHVIAMALAELQTRLPASYYQALQADVASIVDLTIPVTQADFDSQKKVLLSGQLKALARPFYDRLRMLDGTWLDGQMVLSGNRVAEPGSSPVTYSPYPWSVATTDDSNYSPATVGQLKAAFSLRFETLSASMGTDSDGDGLPDAWETGMGLDPHNADTDGDGIPDASDAAPLIPATVSTGTAGTLLIWAPAE